MILSRHFLEANIKSKFCMQPQETFPRKRDHIMIQKQSNVYYSDYECCPKKACAPQHTQTHAAQAIDLPIFARLNVMHHSL